MERVQQQEDTLVPVETPEEEVDHLALTDPQFRADRSSHGGVGSESFRVYPADGPIGEDAGLPRSDDALPYQELPLRDAIHEHEGREGSHRSVSDLEQPACEAVACHPDLARERVDADRNARDTGRRHGKEPCLWG